MSTILNSQSNSPTSTPPTPTTPQTIEKQLVIAYLNLNVDAMKDILLLQPNLTIFNELRSEYIGPIHNNDYLNQPLVHAAVLTNSPITIDTIIQQFNINEFKHNSIGDCPHILAVGAKRGMYYSVKHLIEKYELLLNDILLQSPNLLDCALLSKNDELILYVIQLFINCNAVFVNPLLLATLSQNGNLKSLQYLIEEYNADIHTIFDGHNLLYYAVRSKNIQLIDYLLLHNIPLERLYTTRFSIHKPLPVRRPIWTTIQYLLFSKYITIDNYNDIGLIPLIEAANDPNTTPELIAQLVALGFNNINGVDANRLTPLERAAACCNLSVVKHLIMKYNAEIPALPKPIVIPTNQSTSTISLTTVESSKESLYHLFVSSGHRCTVEMIEYCSQFQYDINSLDYYRHTPLSRALSTNCCYDIIQSLIQLKADCTLECVIDSFLDHNDDIDVLQYFFDTKQIQLTPIQNEKLLLRAVQDGNLPMMKILIEKYKIQPFIHGNSYSMPANIDIRDSKQHKITSTLLHTAVTIKNNYHVVSHLLSLQQININSYDQWGSTILYKALAHRAEFNPQTIQLLINNGANIHNLTEVNSHNHSLNQRPFQLLLSSCLNNNTIYGVFDCIDIFINQLKLDINNIDQTPILQWCTELTFYTPIIRALLYYTLTHRYKINLNIHNNKKNGETPLHYFIDVLNENDIVQHMILHNYIDINIQTTITKSTPLHHAIQCGNTQIIPFLLEHKASLNTFNSVGMTPLHTIASLEMDNPRMLSLFLQYCDNIDIQSIQEENTPLMVAAKHLQFSNVLILLQHGANISITNIQQATFLHLLCQKTSRVGLNNDINFDTLGDMAGFDMVNEEFHEVDAVFVDDDYYYDDHDDENCGDGFEPHFESIINCIIDRLVE